MDEKLVSEMVQDLQKAVGYEAIPDHAMSFVQLKEESGMSDNAVRNALKINTENGTWAKARRANKTFYWKVL